MDIEELKRFNFSGLEGTGWIERVNPENPRIIDFILRTNLREMMNNRMFSLDIHPNFSTSKFDSNMNSISDITSLVSNKLFEVPLLVKLPLKIFGVKTTNRMDAYRFLERFIVKKPVILPSFITLQKASESCYSSSFGTVGKEFKLFEFKFKILPERCNKTNFNLVKLFLNIVSFEDLIDKKGADGFLKSRKVVKKSTTETKKYKSVTKIHTPATPTRKNAFLKGSSSKEKIIPTTIITKQQKLSPVTLEHQLLLSPRGYLTTQKQLSPTTTSTGSPLSISKFPTVISSDSCSSSDLKDRSPIPIKRLPPLPLLSRRRKV